MVLGEFVILGVLASGANCVKGNGNSETMSTHYVSSVAPFARTGISEMQELIRLDIGSVPSVKSVSVEAHGNSFRVDVLMRDLEYDTCKPVYMKELEFHTEFPAIDFDFNLIPA